LVIVSYKVSTWADGLGDDDGVPAALVTDGSGSVGWATFQHLGYSNPESNNLIERSPYVMVCRWLSSAPSCYFTNSLSAADVKGLCSGADSLNQLGQCLTRAHLKEGGYSSGDHIFNRLLPLNRADNLANQLLLYRFQVGEWLCGNISHNWN
jgi:hypothetical protein